MRISTRISGETFDSRIAPSRSHFTFLSLNKSQFDLFRLSNVGEFVIDLSYFFPYREEVFDRYVI